MYESKRKYGTLLGAYNEEQIERFHQNVLDIKRRNEEKWDVHELADFYWMLNRDIR